MYQLESLVVLQEKLGETEEDIGGVILKFFGRVAIGKPQSVIASGSEAISMRAPEIASAVRLPRNDALGLCISTLPVF